MKNKILWVLTLSGLLFLLGCAKKDDFLNEKSDAKLATLSNLISVEKLLHNEQIFNLRAIPSIAGSSTDDYYIQDKNYATYSFSDRNTYTWSKQIYPTGSDDYNWNVPYMQIFNANHALEALQAIGDNSTKSNILKGTALFYRSIAFFSLLQTYTMPYNGGTNDQLGIPLKLTSDIYEKVSRASEKECYEQIFKDLATAYELLPTATTYNTQPNKNAVNALCSRIYLSIGDYQKAYEFSDKCLQFNSDIVDYNTLKKDFIGISKNTPYPLKEVVYNTTMLGGTFTTFQTAVDTTLYKSYDSDDLRKSIFFTNLFGYPTFDGSYEFKNYNVFGGLANDEILLTRAECFARMGKKDEALADLNALLIKRYKTGTFTPRVASNSELALNLILQERRKELCFRGIRWLDLRRLNTEVKYAITLKRNITGQIYTLPPNDPRYALPIPDKEIQLSGIPQNPR